MLGKTTNTLEDLIEGASLIDRLSNTVEQSEAAQSLSIDSFGRRPSGLEGVGKEQL